MNRRRGRRRGLHKIGRRGQRRALTDKRAQRIRHLAHRLPRPAVARPSSTLCAIALVTPDRIIDSLSYVRPAARRAARLHIT